jgi:tetratricopeptide (TPR) repeat protein
MRRNLGVVVLLTAFFALLPPAAQASDKTSAEASAKTVRVLFIGNSYTYFNDLPAMFASFAKATYPHLDVVVDAVTASGESLQGHWGTGAALRKIQQGRWDEVILQDHVSSATGSFRVDGVRQHERPEAFFDYGERFVRAVSAAKARPVFYQPYETKAKSDDLAYLDYAYTTLGRKTGTPVAPVARVWHRLHDDPDLNLYAEDNAHPSAQGSYLVAATLAATIFGDVPAASDTDSPQHPPTVPESAARKILAAVRAVRAELKAAGDAGPAEAPPFGARPSLVSALPLADGAADGTWSARDDAFDLSLGARLTLHAAAGTPRVELVDYQLHGAFPLPVRDLAMRGNVLSFTTSAQNRTYHLQLARRPEGLEMQVEQARGKNVSYTHVIYRRGAADEHFEFLAKSFDEIARQPSQESFEAFLLGYYERLAARLGADSLARIFMGSSPAGDPFFAILTAEEYTETKRHAEAIRFYTFATHRFPQSCEAFRNLSLGLEAAGRFEEAYKAVLQAESLAPPAQPELLAAIQESKARLEKQRQALPAGG